MMAKVTCNQSSRLGLAMIDEAHHRHPPRPPHPLNIAN
jgi:hypothetical protein